MEVEVVPYEQSWSLEFARRAEQLREALSNVAVRIDHIGSTAISGVAAKPIVDVQISVVSFEPLDAYQLPLERLGYVFHPENLDRSKRFFQETTNTPATNIHVRLAGSWAEQFQLLFRDYVRSHPLDAQRYGQLKFRLSKQFPGDVNRYAEAKGDLIWEILRRANYWSMRSGWVAAPSDA